jgi:dihydroorotate dehydrogenase
VTSPRLKVALAGHDAAEPRGPRRGLRQERRGDRGRSRAGFGFLEVGAATPLAHPANRAPALFRLTEDAAAINRFGFNNDGMDAIAARLARAPRTVPVGLNLGANKDSPTAPPISRGCWRAAGRISISRR